MEPEYEWVDGQPALTFLMAAMVVAFLAMALFMPPDEELPGWGMLVLRGVFVFFGFVAVTLMPRVRIRVYPECMEVQYGLTGLIRFRLEKSKITRVEAVTYNPMMEFGGWGIKGGRGKYAGYTAYTASLSNRALAVETVERKYLFGCPDPEEAEAVIRNLFG